MRDTTKEREAYEYAAGYYRAGWLIVFIWAFNMWRGSEYTAIDCMVSLFTLAAFHFCIWYYRKYKRINRRRK